MAYGWNLVCVAREGLAVTVHVLCRNKLNVNAKLTALS